MLMDQCWERCCIEAPRACAECRKRNWFSLAAIWRHCIAISPPSTFPTPWFNTHTHIRAKPLAHCVLVRNAAMPTRYDCFCAAGL